MPTLADNSYPDISPLLINNEGVTALLLNLKDHKASGPDEIPTTLLKRLAIEISPVLTMIFQASLHQSVIPIDWKLARVVRKEKDIIQVTIDQYHSPVYAANC